MPKIDPQEAKDIIRLLKLTNWHHVTFAIARAWKFCCAYCDLNFYESYGNYLQWSLDHVIPRKLGGTDDPSNLVPCCRVCNSLKNHWDPREAAGPDATVGQCIGVSRARISERKRSRAKVFEEQREKLIEAGLLHLVPVDDDKAA